VSGAIAVSVRGVTRRFGATVALDNVDVAIGAGEFVALLGRSGSGKSTLLRLLAGLDVPSSGSLDVPQERMVVFQEPRLLPWKSALENVALGLKSRNAPELARAALSEVGLGERLHAYPSTLSGGEAQRTALARALVRDPTLLLLDEPFAALDALTRMRMHRLVEALWARHRLAVLLITHDVDEALLLADRALVIERGRVTLNLKIDLPRPRELGMPGFLPLRKTLLSAIGVNDAVLAEFTTASATATSSAAASNATTSSAAIPSATTSSAAIPSAATSNAATSSAAIPSAATSNATTSSGATSSTDLASTKIASAGIANSALASPQARAEPSAVPA
jgi:sulfonate transport system ATP-binding protein